MSLSWRLPGHPAALCPGLLVFMLAARAGAQDKKPPFYDQDIDAEEGSSDTAFTGNITSSSFYFTESAGAEAVGVNGGTPAANASSVDRVFTELRLQLRADHISGGRWDFKADARTRLQLESCEPRLSGVDVIEDCLPSQSGTFGGDERDVRELYLRYRSESYDVSAGRQFVPELAAIKFDGVRVQQNKKARWQLFGFGGLYPRRGSRDYRSDYPTVLADPADPNSEERLLPAVAGAGGTYRKEKIYGSVGVAAILPRGNEIETQLAEANRILVSSNGYWQQSNKTDIYHYAVVDLAGADEFGIRNLSLGLNHRPTNTVSLFAQANHVDTETLNVHAQRELDLVDADPARATRIQNNWYVSRIAQQSGRLGASAAFKRNRFALTGSAALRRRPEISLRPNGPDEPPVVLPLAQALDFNLRFVDREFYRDFRVGAALTRSVGYGDENLDRSKSTVARLEASRDMADGKGEFELEASYVSSSDQDLVQNCNAGVLDFLACFGTSESTIYGVGGLVFYRPKKNWFAMGMLTIASQTLVTTDSAGAPVSQPSILMLTGFARLAYRF